MRTENNNTHLESCSCPTGNPPCSFCTDTFICDSCENREYSAEAVQTDLGWICEHCQTEQPAIAIPEAPYKTAKVYQGGKIIGLLRLKKWKVKTDLLTN
jgi:hypothetical protein